MAISQERIQYLLKAWSSKTATTAEETELIEAVSSGGTEEEIRTHIQQLLTQYQPETLPQVDWQTLYDQIKLKASIEEKPVRRMGWMKWVAAAAVIIIVATTALVISNQWGTKSRSIGEKSPNTQDVPAPTETRAVITLANGSKVYLDSAGNGILAQENNVNVVRSADGIISYELNRQDAKTQGAIAYNTLFNPRGSKVISLTLSDGTKVWLNSESSLKYPIAFNGNTREVEITGEAYFEVAHIAPGFSPGKKGPQNQQGFSPMPFIVKKGDVSVTVLGTHFNVNAYDDEDALRVTLLEGSVKVTAANAANAAVIKPGQQAVLNQANPSITRIEVQTNVDVDQVMSWKNGLFALSSTDVATLMRQVGRWYNVEVVFAGPVPDKQFGGSISRDISLKNVLAALKEYGIQTEFSNGKVIIK